jgi:hypothetical protein
MRDKKPNIFVLMIVIAVSLVWSTAFAEEPSSEISMPNSVCAIPQWTPTLS